MKHLLVVASIFSALLVSNSSRAQFGSTEEILIWLEESCLADTTGLSEYCDLIEFAVFCGEGDSAYCDSLDYAINDLAWVDGLGGSSEDSTGTIADDFFDEVVEWLTSQCAEDSTGVYS